MRRCVAYIHDPDTILTLNLKVNRPQVFFVLWHTIFGTWMYHHGMMCHIHSWRWPLFSISKLYFHHYIFFHEFLSGQGCLCSITMRHCTSMTFVRPWPLTYTLVTGGILSEFYSQFLFNNLGRPLLGYHNYSLSFSETRLWVKKIFKEIPQFRHFNLIKVLALGVGRSWNLRFFSLPYWFYIPIW